MKNIILTISIIISFHSVVLASDSQEFYAKTEAFLKANVSNGLVDYKAIAADSKELESLITMIENAEVAKIGSKDYQAFYINAYNLQVINGIVTYNLKSPMDKAGFFDKIKVNVAGEKLTLNDIENKKLRAVVKDARFHFVLVCGALGCPPLINKAYKPDILEHQLETQTKKAINNDQFIRVNKNKVAVSQIFEWYKVDFTTNGSTILEFIAKYRTQPLPEKAKLSFYTYDWKVNKL